MDLDASQRPLTTQSLARQTTTPPSQGLLIADPRILTSSSQKFEATTSKVSRKDTTSAAAFFSIVLMLEESEVVFEGNGIYMFVSHAQQTSSFQLSLSTLSMGRGAGTWGPPPPAAYLSF